VTGNDLKFSGWWQPVAICNRCTEASRSAKREVSLARNARNAFRRANKRTHKIAAAYGKPIYVEKNGKIIALKPKIR